MTTGDAVETPGEGVERPLESDDRAGRNHEDERRHDQREGGEHRDVDRAGGRGALDRLLQEENQGGREREARSVSEARARLASRQQRSDRHSAARERARGNRGRDERECSDGQNDEQWRVPPHVRVLARSRDDRSVDDRVRHLGAERGGDDPATKLHDHTRSQGTRHARDGSRGLGVALFRDG